MTRQEILLVQLSEECAEVIQEISKTLRFGKDEVYYKTDLTNAERVSIELEDLIGVYMMLMEEGVLPKLDETKVEAKKEKVNEYIGYSVELGIVK